MRGYNPYIEFIKAHKGSGLSRDQLLNKYYSLQHNKMSGIYDQMGGDYDLQQLRDWWQYIMGRMHQSNDPKYRDQFINDLITAANGQPITRTIFTIAHAMWHGDGYINPGIFGDKKQQLLAINDGTGNGQQYKSIMEFIEDYLDQR